MRFHRSSQSRSRLANRRKRQSSAPKPRKPYGGLGIGPLRLEPLEDRSLLTSSALAVGPFIANLASSQSAATLNPAIFSPGTFTPDKVTGQVSHDGDTYDVSLDVAYGPGLNVSLNGPTWLLIHGLNSDPSVWMQNDGNENDSSVIAGIIRQRPADRIVVLDWSAIASILTGMGVNANNWIPYVAGWTADALRQYGFSNPESQLNLIGHSWGADIAAVLAEDLGRVNSIIALDPGHDGAGIEFNPDDTNLVDFRKYSNFSWSFHTPEVTHATWGPFWYDDVFGSTKTPQTATEAFVVLNTDHIRIPEVFASLLSGNVSDTDTSGNDVSHRFPLYSVLHGISYPYLVPHKFAIDGSTTGGSAQTPFDAVFAANGTQANNFADGTSIMSVQFFNTPKGLVTRYAKPQLCVDQTISTSGGQNSGANDLAVSSPQAVVAASSSADESPASLLSLNTVTNFMATTSQATTAVFFASDDPDVQGDSYVIGSRPVVSLSPGQRSMAQTSLSLSSLPHSVLSSGQIYVAVALNPGDDPKPSDLDWLPVSLAGLSLKPDLVGTSLDVEPRPTTYGWGQTVNVSYRFTNQGSGYAMGPFTNGIYLSHDTVIGPNDVLIRPDQYGGVAANATLGTAFDVTLPSGPPPGFSDGPAYLLLAVDDGHAVAESNESNNSGVGVGIDYLPVSISGTPPTPGAPTIGSFTASASSIAPGQHLTLTATDVTDDGVVNEVVFYLDANDNGNLDSADTYIDNGSKNLTTFTAQVDTSKWPVGTDTLFARAKDGDGNYSLVKTLQITVLNLAPGADAYEHNDTPSSATYLGANGTYALDKLSITQGDDDYFAFSIPNGKANFEVQVDFTQYKTDKGLEGNLVLEVINPYGADIGISDSQAQGATSDQVSGVGGAGRYLVHVSGGSLFGLGGGTATNPDYSLWVTVAAGAGLPITGALSATPATVHQGDVITLRLDGSSTPPGTFISSAAFYLDTNRDGVIEPATDTQLAVTYSYNGEYGWTGSTAGWAVGTNNVMAYVESQYTEFPSGPGDSLATSLQVQVLPNLPPQIGSLAVPSTVIQGAPMLLTASAVTGNEPVTEVDFFQDANGDGMFDQGDVDLGKGTNNGDSWTLEVPTSALPIGPMKIIAEAIDNRGQKSLPVTASLTIQAPPKQPPNIDSLTGPGSIVVGGTLDIQANNVTDANGNVDQVAFYLDSNQDGVLDQGDRSLGDGTQSGSDWKIAIDTSGWPAGETLLFAEASDGSSPPLTAVESLEVTVTNNTAPQFAAGANQSVLENAGPQTVAGWASAISPGIDPDEVGQSLTFVVTTDNNALFAAAPAIDASTGTLTYTPAADADGVAHVSVVLHDDGGTANGGVDTSVMQTFTITVTFVNDAPSFIVGADQVANDQDGPQDISGWATSISPGPGANESGQNLNLILSNDNNRLFSVQPSIDSNGNLTYTPDPTAYGVAKVTVMLHDNGGTANGGVDTSAAQTFTITIYEPPVITSPPSTTFAVDAAGYFKVSATGFPAPSLTKSGNLPTGVTLDPTSGELTGRPAAGMEGSYPITFTAQSIAGKVVQSFVLEVDRASAISSASGTTFVVGQYGTFQVTTLGNPSPNLSETGQLPMGVTFDKASGMLTGTPADGTGDVYNITFTATNYAGGNFNQAFTLTVEEAPSITVAPEIDVLAGSSFNPAISTGGFPRPSLTESGALPQGLSFDDGTGKFNGTPALGSGSAYKIQLTAHNGVGTDASQSVNLVVQEPPAITSSNAATFTVGSLSSFAIATSGFPLPTLTESGPLPDGITFDKAAGTLSGTPTAGTAKTYPITIYADNGVGSEASQAFSLTINDRLAITSTNSATFTVGTGGAFAVTTTGASGQITESGSLPPGVTFNSATGALGGTPASGTGGIYAVRFTASNGSGSSVVQTFTLTVNEAPAITRADQTTVVAGMPASFSLLAAGFPLPTLSYSGNLPSGMTFDDATGQFIGTPVAGSEGTYSITLMAHNAIGDSTQSFSLIVVAPASPPGPIVVTNTNDAGPGSLRQAILDANSHPGSDTIDFQIPGPAPFAISPQSELPEITDPLVLDGTSQPGFTGTPLVVLNGDQAGSASGLIVLANDSVVRGFVIDNFADDGIWVLGGRNVIAGNYIGIDITGTSKAPNHLDGVAIAAANNTIGGTSATDRNVISGNALYGVSLYGTDTTGNLVIGNYIGTDVTGNAVLGNGGSGVFLVNGASNNRIGADGADLDPQAEGNLVSGNGGDGVTVWGARTDGNIVAGNFIGTDSSGKRSLGNDEIGVHIEDGAANNRIGTNGDGDNDTSERNVISGNLNDGVLIADAGSDNNVVAGNYIGSTRDGTTALGNGHNGITVAGGAASNRIGAAASDADMAGEGNVVSGNGLDGIDIQGAGTTENRVAGNFIGSDYTGTVALANKQVGVRVSNGAGRNIIGTDGDGQSDLLERNVISANALHGVFLTDPGTDANVVAGNYIGTAADGLTALGNAWSGVYLANGAQANRIGVSGSDADAVNERNVISGNGNNGVALYGASGNVVSGNLIGTDLTGNNELSNGENGIVIGTGAQQNLVGTNADGRGDTLERNLISGNLLDGILLTDAGTDNNVVAGDFIGTKADGASALGNRQAGVEVGYGANSNRIGAAGSDANPASERNVISGNVGDGVVVEGTGTSQNVVAGNFIGIAASGSDALGNQYGVLIDKGASNNRVGTDGDGIGDSAERNVISGDASFGVAVFGAGTNDNVLAGNFIGTDDTGKQSLGNGSLGVWIGDGAQRNRVGTGGLESDNVGELNVISGNAFDGIEIVGPGTDNNVVAGNYIGTDVAGTDALGNGNNGVLIADGAWFNRVGTNSDGANDALERNIISANGESGVALTYSASANIIAGNYIGTDFTGTVALGNGQNGVGVSDGASGNRIGGAPPTAGNVISGNTWDGISLDGLATAGNVISGNVVGAAPDGLTALGNGRNGVSVLDGATSNVIGDLSGSVSNLLAFNDAAGVRVQAGPGNTVTADSIRDNQGLGIDVGPAGETPNDPIDADGVQNFPEIESAAWAGDTLTVHGRLNSSPTSSYRIEFFATATSVTGPSNGAMFLGSTIVTTNYFGNATFTWVLNSSTPALGLLTATATNKHGDTSEFSQPVSIGVNTGSQDQEPPAVDLLSARYVNPGDAKYQIDVSYTDNLALDPASIGASNILVTGPGGFSQIATVPANLSFADLPERAYRTYEITAPGGAWMAADDGVYTISLLPNQVKDTAGNVAVGGVLGTFVVDLADSGYPLVGSLTVTPNPPIQGAALTLTANNVNFGSYTIGKDVEFYLDKDGDGYANFFSDQLLGRDFDGSDGWSITLNPSYTAEFLTPGPHTLLALAYGSNGIENNILGPPARLSVDVLERQPPVAQLSAEGNFSADGSAYDFAVTYSDNDAVAVASIDNANVLVNGPNGFSKLATLVGAVPESDSATITANYRISGDGGTWSVADDGVYTISVQPNQVKDRSGNPVLAGVLGTFTVTVKQAPTITSPSDVTFAVGQTGTFTVTASGNPAPTFAETGTMPAGLTFDAASGTIAGTPSAGSGGVHSIQAIAYNGVGNGQEQQLALTVNESPAITSSSMTTFVTGQAASFAITTTGYPRCTFIESGALPGGVSFDSTNGVLAGAPVAGSGGTYSIGFTVDNGVGGAVFQAFTLVVNEAPAISIDGNLTFTPGEPNSVTVTPTGYPTPTISEVGSLPSGVTFDAASRTLAGVPTETTGSIYPITFVASNSAGVVSQDIDLVLNLVNQPPTFTLLSNYTTNEVNTHRNSAQVNDNGGSSEVVVPSFAFDIASGPPKEPNQHVVFVATTDHPDLFAVQPTLDGTSSTTPGALRFVLANDAFGTAFVNVYAQDDGGTANGGNDKSVSKVAAIVVEGVPLLVTPATLTTVAGLSGSLTLATFTDPQGPQPVSDYTATIDWGDGQTTSNPSITANSGVFTVSGFHTYAEADLYSPIVTVDRNGLQPSVATASVTVNTPPVPTANPDNFVLGASGPYAGSGATRVLANDTSADHQPQNLVATLVSSTTNGTLTLRPDGSFVYMPGPSFQGIDRFTYQVSEGGTTGNTVTVTLLSYNASLVDKLFQQVLHRSAEDSGLIYWASQLDAGKPLDVVATGIFNSTERLDPLVTQFYQQYLGRGTDPQGLAYWVADWQAKGDPRDVVDDILSSPEFFDDAGDTDSGFVSLLYERVLQRVAEASGLAYWVGLMFPPSNESRFQIASQFYDTHEKHVDLVDFLFGEYFQGVTPLPDATPYVTDLDQGQTETQVERAIIDSSDYRDNPSEPAAGTVGRALYPH